MTSVLGFSGALTSQINATPKRAADAYAATVRAQSPSAARRISLPRPAFVLQEIAAPAPANANGILLPNLSGDSARTLMTLDFSVPEPLPRAAALNSASRIYADNFNTIHRQLSALPPQQSERLDFRI